MERIRYEEEPPQMTRIKVIGVGGGGCNAVDDMITKGFSGVEFYAVNTDLQALQRNRAPNLIQIGDDITAGKGAGAIPELGEQAARSAEKQIRECLAGADMVFITAGMGGGTGTGAGPVIAEIAKSMDILSVGIVTKPFSFEGPQRMRRAVDGIRRLKDHVDTMIVIMNDKLMETVGHKTPLREAFAHVNTVLAQGIRAISDLISMPGLINVDFRDVRTIMGETGGAVMGVGIGKGENRAIEAVKKACHSPLQEKIVIDGAKGVLINITGGPDITMHEINEATSMVYESADPDANIIFGVVIDERMTDEMRVTIIATGFSEVTDSAVSSGALDTRSFRPRASLFNQPPAGGASGDGSQGGQAAVQSAPPVREPNPIPAVQRKRENESAPEPAPALNFERDDNPLKGWEEPVRSEPSRQPSAPVAGPASEKTELPPPAAPSFRDVAQPVGQQDTDPAENDPYHIPAIKRRRGHWYE